MDGRENTQEQGTNPQSAEDTEQKQKEPRMDQLPNKKNQCCNRDPVEETCRQLLESIEQDKRHARSCKLEQRWTSQHYKEVIQNLSSQELGIYKTSDAQEVFLAAVTPRPLQSAIESTWEQKRKEAECSKSKDTGSALGTCNKLQRDTEKSRVETESAEHCPKSEMPVDTNGLREDFGRETVVVNSLSEPIQNENKCLVNNSQTEHNCARIATGNNKFLDDFTEPSNGVCNQNSSTSSQSNLIRDSNTNESREHQVSSEMNDPFDLTFDEDGLHAKYRPVKRKHETSAKAPDRESHFAQNDEDDDLEWGRTDRHEIAILPTHLNDRHFLSLPERNRVRQGLRVAYMHSDDLMHCTNQLIKVQGRARLVHGLFEAYKLWRHVIILEPQPATDEEICGFHCPDYINFLKYISASSDPEGDADVHSENADVYGLSYDCPVQKGIYDIASLIGGATIVTAKALIEDKADIAINWYGGWHHAKRDSASGFCYINDIVLGILKLRQRFDQVLYVDLDLHHGDGVEEAFASTRKVMTVSFHKYTPGFFPGTGGEDCIGTGRGKFHTVNVPLRDGIGDEMFYAVFCRVMGEVREKFLPKAIVVQCGADGLAEDPMQSFNLTHLGLARCVCYMLAWNCPTLLVGGGGYNFPNTAKYWTFLTAMAVGKKLETDIPEHEFLSEYGPRYDMKTSAGNRRDNNTKKELLNIIEKIRKNVQNIADEKNVVLRRAIRPVEVQII